MLSVVQIRGLKPREKLYKIGDADRLFLLVQPSDARLWRFKFKHHGIERKLSLGTFPEVTLQQARAKPEEARAKLVDGIDPVEEKRQREMKASLAAATTFRAGRRRVYREDGPRGALAGDPHQGTLVPRPARQGHRPPADGRDQPA